MNLPADISPAPEGGFVARDVVTGTTTQGETITEALANRREAAERYSREFRVNRRPRPSLDISH
jgi:predicted RNase H-like HicB family nuclease